MITNGDFIMKFMKVLKTALTILLCLSLLCATLASCDSPENETEETTTTVGTSGAGQTEVEQFDYMGADMSDYISLDPIKYGSFSVSVDKKYEITDENVSAYIKTILENNKQRTQITDRAVQKGDTVMIYYEGLLDGVAFNGGTWAETEGNAPYELEIGSGKFIEGFEDGLIGIVPAQTSKEAPVALELTFPEKYQSADLAGKTVIFNVYIKYIAGEEYVPEYNATTVTEILGFKAEGEDVLAEFEAAVKEQMASERDAEVLAATYEYLVQSSDVKAYPEGTVEHWYDYYMDQIEQYVSYYAMYGYTVTVDEMALMMLGLEKGADWKSELTEMAQNIVKNTLVYYSIIQNSNISMTDAEYNDQIQYYIDYYKQSGKDYSAEEIIEGIGEATIRENVLFEKVDDLLLSNCTVIYIESEKK
jgi:trigger factor